MKKHISLPQWALYTAPALAIGAFLGFLALTANAHPPGRLADQLGLNDTQQQQLGDVMSDFRPDGDEMRKRHQEVQDLIRNGNVAAAADLAAEQARQQVYRRAEMRQRLAEILTPEQLTQFDELRSQIPDLPGRGPRHGPGSRQQGWAPRGQQ